MKLSLCAHSSGKLNHGAWEEEGAAAFKLSNSLTQTSLLSQYYFLLRAT